MTAHMGKAASKAISNFQIAVNRILLTSIPWRLAMSIRRMKSLKYSAEASVEQLGTPIPVWSALLQDGAHHSQSGLGTPSMTPVIVATRKLSRSSFRRRLCRFSESITPTSPNPKLQFTPSFAPAATPCELHPTSAHPPHSTSHHRKCCPPVRLTLCIPERMVHA